MRTLLAYSKKPGSDYEREGSKLQNPRAFRLRLPILVAAADESRDELQDIWASLLAAAADPARAKAFRIAFIEAVKKMDPLDAAVLQSAQAFGGDITGKVRNDLAKQLHASRDETDVSIANLEKLELVRPTNPPNAVVSPFGREFLRAVSDQSPVTPSQAPTGSVISGVNTRLESLCERACGLRIPVADGALDRAVTR